MSTSKPIDISTLKFTAPIDEDEDLEDDSESEDSYDDEFPFMKEYRFTITDPNLPPLLAEDEEQDPSCPPEPLASILVRTIDRRLIPAGEFQLQMDGVSHDFLQFSMAVFDSSGRIKPMLYQPKSPERGTGVWGPEINRGTLAYIEEIFVNPRYQRQGVGRWAIEKLLKSDVLAHCPFFFLWATAVPSGRPFAGPDDFKSKQQDVISFWRSVGFRRVAGTWFFGYARNPKHPMRSLKAEDDTEESQAKGFAPFDTLNACLAVLNA